MESLAFIVGAPRSGTYLLLTRLSKNYNISLPVETHFIPLFRRYISLWGNLSERRNRERLLYCIYEFLKIWTPRSEQDRDYNKVFKNSLLITEDDSDNIIDSSYDYPSLVHEIYKVFAKRKGRTSFGDKSAFYRHIDLNIITSSVKSAKVVHIIRDGRDVSLSWRNIFTGPVTVLESAILWSSHVEEKCRWGVQNPHAYFEIKYEDLIEDEDATLRAVAEFLEIEKLAEYEKSDELESILSSGDMHAKIAGPILKDNKEKWRTQMSVANRLIFTHYAGDVLKYMGYAVTDDHIGFLDKFKFKLHFVDNKIRKILSGRYWRFIVKNHLPLIIWAFDFLGLSLSNIVNSKKYKQVGNQDHN